MTKLQWDQVGQRRYETGVDHGVLYLANDEGAYVSGYAWNGLTTVTESPSGADANKQYADNGVYLNLVAAEEFGGTIEAFTYPNEWSQCDGSAITSAGVTVGQQPRRPFGLSYRTLIGNDLQGTAYGYKLHLVYSALAAPSEAAYGTINDSPEAIAFSWEFSTTPVDPDTDGPDGKPLKPTSRLTIDSTQVDEDSLAALEQLLYGTSSTTASLPSPKDVLALFAGTVSQATPVAPTYNSTTHVITIPTVTGVVYKINGVTKTGTVTITQSTVVNAVPAAGYVFSQPSDDDWLFTYA
jgi:hypothetical protein